jgi:outer membrane protein OmpA-like peptidoglycan-associated protein
MYRGVLKSASQIFLIALVISAPVTVAAQATPTTGPSPVSYASRWDIFAGYSYLAPKGTVDVPQPDGSVVPYSYDPVNVGGLFSGAYYFNRDLGAQVEFAEHNWGTQSSNGSNIGTHGNNDGFDTLGFGTIYRYPTGKITPFLHGLVNVDRVGGPDFNPYTWGAGLTFGGGMDYEINHHLALRIFQADYQFMHVDFGSGPYGGRASINATRLSTGIVFHLGSVIPPEPVSLSCSSNPESVYPGANVIITCTPGSLNPKMNAIYSYSGAGAKGSGTTATVDTSSLAPGSYTVQGSVKEGKKGKEGVKPWQNALATASFTVKAFEPPTISCTANPTTIKPGETSTITCHAVSPQNLPLTYSYSASAGNLTGNGSTAIYSSAGAPTGSVGITAKVSDDKGNTASADTTVTIEAPPPPPAPHAQALCSISFTNDKRRPTRVDNEAKACLDQIAINLQQQPDAKAVLVGESDTKEKALTARQEKYQKRHARAHVTYFAAQRAVNAKDYLVTEKGIDASRISTATSGEEGQMVQDYLIPSGANFEQDVPGTTPVDETQIKPQKRIPLPTRHHRRAHRAPAAK